MHISTLLIGALIGLGAARPAMAQSYDEWTATDISQFWSLPETAPYRSHIGSTTTGDAELAIPLELPDSRLTPNVALQYRAQGGDDPYFGTGWGLGVDEIKRDTTFGAPTYDIDDRFVGPDGLLAWRNGAYWAEIDRSGHRRRYTFDASTDEWTVTSKSGVRDTYSGVREGPDGTFAWARTRRENAFGDIVAYDYADGLLDRIEYGGNALTGDPSEYEVEFTYVGRDCVRTNYRAGFLVAHDTRLGAVEVFHDGKPVRRYEFAFEPGCPDLLESVTVRGWDADGVEVADTPWAFSYHSDPGFSQVDWPSDPWITLGRTVSEYDWVQESDSITDTEFEISEAEIAFGNTNGDPLPDIINRFGVYAGQTLDSWGAAQPPLHAFDRDASAPHADAIASLGRQQGARESRSGLPYDARLTKHAYMDLDGDGFEDVVRVGSPNWSVCWGEPFGLCNASTLLAPPAGALFIGKSLQPVGQYGGATQYTFEVAALLDVDGDGGRDFIAFEDGNAQLAIAYFDLEDRQWQPPVYIDVPWCTQQALSAMGTCALTWAATLKDDFAETNTGETTAGFHDMNGDGLQDFVVIPYAEAWQVFFNNGSGWEAATRWGGYRPPAMSVHVEDGHWQTFCTEVMMADLDGDGLPDVIDAAKGQWARNTGDGFELAELSGASGLECLNAGKSEGEVDIQDTADSDFDPDYDWDCDPLGGDCEEAFPEEAYPMEGVMTVTATQHRAARDWTGDGTLDVVDVASDSAWVGRFPANHLLARIDTQASESFVSWRATGELYPSGAWFEEGEVSSAIPALRAVEVVDHVATDSWEVEYEFSHGAYDAGRRRFMGFGREARIEDGWRIELIDRHTTWPLQGLPFDHYRGDLGLPYWPMVRIETPLYQVIQNGGRLVLPKQEVVTQFEGTYPPDAVSKSAERTYDDEGNLLAVQIRGSDAGIEDDTWIEFAYAEGGTHGRTAVCEMTVLGWDDRLPGWAVASHRIFDFDGLPSGSCTLYEGAITGVTYEHFGYGIPHQQRRVAFDRNVYGQLIGVEQPSGAYTEYVYDPTSRYAEWAVNDLGHSSFVARDIWGNPNVAIEPSSRTTTTVYDGFGRLVEQSVSSAGDAPQVVQARVHQDGALPRTATSYWDGDAVVEYRNAWGDPVQVRNFLGDRWSVLDISYLPDGQVGAAGEAYTQPGGMGDSFTGFGAPRSTTREYDGLGRWSQTTDLAGNVVREAGALWTSIIEDQEGFRAHTVNDAYGRAIERFASHVTDGTLPGATYEYDPMGRLLWAIDPDGVRSDLYWSSTGELLRIENPDIGWREYAYDVDGHLTDAFDSEGRYVQYKLDSLGRAITRSEDVGAGLDPVEEYQWDDQFPGSLDAVRDAAGTVSFGYDKMGRIASEERQFLDGTRATLEYAYDLSDRLRLMTLPDGVRIEYDYAFGRLDSVKTHIDGEKHLVARLEYDDAGRVVTAKGKLDVELEIYRDLMGRVETLEWVDETTTPATTVAASYGYLDNGLLLWRDLPQGYTSYGYDPAKRATVAHGAEPTTWQLTPGGDLTQLTNDAGTFTLTYGPLDHRLRTAQGPGLDQVYHYDESGAVYRVEDQLVGDFIHIYRDGNGRPTSATRPRQVPGLPVQEGYHRVYGYGGSPVIEQIDGRTAYRHGVWERIVEWDGEEHTATTVHVLDLPFLRIVDGVKVQTVAADIQGTPLVQNLGGDTHEVNVDIYGAMPVGGKGDSMHHWLDLPRSLPMDLVGTGSRFYEPRTTSFLSPDPMLAGAGFTAMAERPYGMNAYRYGFNNPAAFTDRSGDVPIETIPDLFFVAADIGQILGGGIAMALGAGDDQFKKGLFNLAIDAPALVTPYVPAGTGRVAGFADEAATGISYVTKHADDVGEVVVKSSDDDVLGELGSELGESMADDVIAAGDDLAGACFVAYTGVETIVGPTPIQDIEVGQLVVSHSAGNPSGPEKDLTKAPAASTNGGEYAWTEVASAEALPGPTWSPRAACDRVKRGAKWAVLPALLAACEPAPTELPSDFAVVEVYDARTGEWFEGVAELEVGGSYLDAGHLMRVTEAGVESGGLATADDLAEADATWVAEAAHRVPGGDDWVLVLGDEDEAGHWRLSEVEPRALRLPGSSLRHCRRGR